MISSRGVAKKRRTQELAELTVKSSPSVAAAQHSWRGGNHRCRPCHPALREGPSPNDRRRRSAYRSGFTKIAKTTPCKVECWSSHPDLIPSGFIDLDVGGLEHRPPGILDRRPKRPGGMSARPDAEITFQLASVGAVGRVT